MKRPYSPSTVEKWVSDLFIRADILSPADIIPERISEAFGIDYSLWNGTALSYRSEDGKRFYILESKSADRLERKKHFFHELCHALRHVGDQRKMIESFRQKQEWDAKLFVLYAAIPYHMINFDKNYTFHDLMHEFDVSEELAFARLEDIRQKSISERQYRHHKFVSIYTPFSLHNCTNETKRLMQQLGKQTGVDYL